MYWNRNKKQSTNQPTIINQSTLTVHIKQFIIVIDLLSIMNRLICSTSIQQSTNINQPTKVFYKLHFKNICTNNCD